MIVGVVVEEEVLDAIAMANAGAQIEDAAKTSRCAAASSREYALAFFIINEQIATRLRR